MNRPTENGESGGELPRPGLQEPETGLADRLQQVERALGREQALGRIRNRIIALRHLTGNPGELEHDWMEELRGLGIPINAMSLQFPADRAGYFTSHQAAFLTDPHLEASRLADFPWMAEVWESGKPVLVGRARLDQAGFDPEVQLILEVPLPGGGSLGVNSKEQGAFGEEAIHTIVQFAGLLAEARQQLRDLERLHDHEMQLRAILDGAYDSFILMDAGGRIVDWNAQASTTFGWSREEALGRPVAELIIPLSFRQAHQEGLQRFLATGKGPALHQRIEITAMRRDGSEFPVELALTPIRWREGHLFAAFLHDIAVRKQAEQDIHLSLALQRVRNEILLMGDEADWEKVIQTFQQEVSALIPYDNYSITLVSPQHDLSILYYSDGGKVQKNTAAAVYRAVSQALKTGLPVYRRNRKEMEEFGDQILPRFHSVVDVPFAGGTVAVNSTQEDAFSERDLQLLERFAQVLNEAHRRLEDLKVLALKEEHLHQAQKLEAIGQLATGVAHEINNPLTSVLGYSELLLRRPLDPEVRGHLETIHQEGQRAQEIAARLLQFVRRQKASTQPLSLNLLVQEVLVLARQQFDLDHVQLSATLAEGLPPQNLHPGQIQQLLLALLQNSREAIQKTGRAGQIKVQTRQHGAWVRLVVEDDGPGIPAPVRERIFEPFFTTKAVGKGLGTGMGLSLCFAIAREHGGQLWAEPCTAGACLVLELPVGAGAGDSTAKETMQNEP